MLIPKFEHLHLVSKIWFFISISYWIMAILDLINYNLLINIPVDPNKLIRMEKNGCYYYYKRILDIFEWVHIIIVIFILWSYIGLVLVWAILGAILNS